MNPKMITNTNTNNNYEYKYNYKYIFVYWRAEKLWIQIQILKSWKGAGGKFLILPEDKQGSPDNIHERKTAKKNKRKK